MSDEIVYISTREFCSIFKKLKNINKIFIGFELKNKNFGWGKIISIKKISIDYSIKIKFFGSYEVFDFSFKSFDENFELARTSSKKLRLIYRLLNSRIAVVFCRRIVLSKKYKQRCLFCHKKTGYKTAAVLFKNFINQLRQKYTKFGVYHYTDFTNLESIFKEGFLYSRVDCINKKLSFTDAADHEVLDKASYEIKNKVRFYFRPNTPTLFKNEGIKPLRYAKTTPHMPVPVCLLFEDKLILLDTTEFANGNAASKYTSIDSTYNFFKSMEWDLIFHEGPIEDYEKAKIINKRNAELLSYKPVSLKYLKKVIFRTQADFKRACNLFGFSKNFIVDIDYFSDKSKNYFSGENMVNFIYDYDIKVNLNELKEINLLEVKIDYWRTSEEHRIDLRLLDRKGNVLPLSDFCVKKNFKFGLLDYSDIYH